MLCTLSTVATISYPATALSPDLLDARRPLARLKRLRPSYCYTTGCYYQYALVRKATPATLASRVGAHNLSWHDTFVLGARSTSYVRATVVDPSFVIAT